MTEKVSLSTDSPEISVVASIRKQQSKDPLQSVEEQQKDQPIDQHLDSPDVAQSHREGEEDDEEDQVVDQGSDLDWRGTLLLAVQHASSSWGYRSAEFAYPLYLVTLFTNSLLPASLYGFITTFSAILFSGSVGTQVDRFASKRVRTLRTFIFCQKLFVAASYAIFVIMFYNPKLIEDAQNGGKGPLGNGNGAEVWSCFAAITFFGCGVILSNVGVSVCVERDWVTEIAASSPARLTRLNAIMRRIDLLSKLLSPLFVSLLTTSISYKLSAVILLSICLFSTGFELWFVGTVHDRFSTLQEAEIKAKERDRAARAQELQVSSSNGSAVEMQAVGQNQTSKIPSENRTKTTIEVGKLLRVRLRSLTRFFKNWVRMEASDWKEFAAMPVFISSISISLLYMSVLSFDSTFLAYLKSETDYGDPFIAGMRAVCVVGGLLGTVLMPLLEKRIGVTRTGSWSITSEFLSLIPTLISLWLYSPSKPNSTPPTYITTLLFTGLALSRIGLWSFDLSQLSQLQTSLAHNPRRNSLSALQFSMQNFFDLFHYALTLIWQKPKDFKYPATVSFAAIGIATVLYIGLYARRLRGHLVHLDKLGMERLLGRKKQ